MKTKSGEALTKKSRISNKDLPKEIAKAVRSAIQDLREIERKSSKSLDEVVEMFTGEMIDKLEEGGEDE